MRPRHVGPLAAVLLLSACMDEGRPGGADVAAQAFPVFAEAHLGQGRSVWMGTCRACHGTGLAGAPVIGDRKAWADRISQGKVVLYTHAIEGLFGPMGTQMPPRGGNDKLTDAEVKAAVDYMVAALGH